MFSGKKCFLVGLSLFFKITVYNFLNGGPKRASQRGQFNTAFVLAN